jgi:hypothetical protein
LVRQRIFGPIVGIGIAALVGGIVLVARGRSIVQQAGLETTANSNDKGSIATASTSGRIRGVPQSEALHVVERFRRVDAGTVSYTVTVDDPNVYTQPWTVSMPLVRDDNYRIYEYACHEANYAVGNILRGARLEEGK